MLHAVSTVRTTSTATRTPIHTPHTPFPDSSLRAPYSRAAHHWSASPTLTSLSIALVCVEALLTPDAIRHPSLTPPAHPIPLPHPSTAYCNTDTTPPTLLPHSSEAPPVSFSCVPGRTAPPTATRTLTPHSSHASHTPPTPQQQRPPITPPRPSPFQGGPLWWASKHRSHHVYCDTDARDPHSPALVGDVSAA